MHLANPPNKSYTFPVAFTPRRKTKSKTKTKVEALYPVRATRLPREIESAAGLWLDFFQQFCDLVLDRDELNYNDRSNKDEQAIQRARILADSALSAFQERFPGVHPQ